MISKQDLTGARQQLSSLLSPMETFVVGDDEVTTACSTLAILVASLFAETEDPKIIQSITQLPMCLVVLVLDRAAHIGLRNEENWILTVDDLRQRRWEDEGLEGKLWALMEDFWRHSEYLDIRWRYEIARDGYLLHGSRQWWVDPESPALQPSDPLFRDPSVL